ncbi:MAG: hypothetical protein CM15mP30_6260 [Pelagibacteraceae bacterium]|nr:MAG: hypothetical protein CM15mP30_6260 [Pelagibacteraceae bacterium]
MKYAIIFFSLILPNLAFTEILEKFPLACICDKSINALKYFDCKQKVSGTQLDIIENKKNKNIMIFSSFDEKNYQLFDEDNLSLIFNYDTEDYISSISIKENLDLVFSISYKEYNKKWAYDLKCVSIKKRLRF